MKRHVSSSTAQGRFYRNASAAGYISLYCCTSGRLMVAHHRTVVQFANCSSDGWKLGGNRFLNSMSPASVETLLTDLHGSLNDPLLDSMNFLNEVTGRYPDAISFAPGRPHEEHFDVATIADYLGAYTDHLRRDRGLDPAAVSRTLFQYGRTNGII